MKTRKSVVAAGVVLLGIAAGGAAAPGTLPSHRNIITFSRPVALPGVSLGAGTYVFELADPNGSQDAVVVLNRDRRQVYFLGMTERVPRPVDLPADRIMTFAEAPRGVPAPIAAWYPNGAMWGHRFIYAAR